MHKPSKSYIIWMSQRTGSTYLCRCLQNTGVAGNPNEWLNTYSEHPKSLFQRYNAGSPAELQRAIWKRGCGQNNIFGLKAGIYDPNHTKRSRFIKDAGGCSSGCFILERDKYGKE